jgi:hypothetical protein
MEHAKDLYRLSPHAVGEDIRRTRDDKLSGIGYTTGAPGRGIVTEYFYGFADALRDIDCR